MKEMSVFQIIFTLVFAAFIIVGVTMFALYQGSGGSDIAQVTLWGTLKKEDFNSFMHNSGLDTDKTITITYVEKDPTTFDHDFVEALASGTGPDIFFLPQDSILTHQDKIFVVPFANYSERTFKDTFIEEGELYTTPQGILGFPFTIDPLVMYWNRDIYSNAGLSRPPASWSEFYTLTQKLTKKEGDLNITQAAVPLGEFVNISHVVPLLSTLIMQAGDPIATKTDSGVDVTLSDRLNFTIPPAESALSFYTQFSNPLSSFYTWNRSLPSSKDYFIAGKSATYFGFGSELSEIRAKNPNLNFDLAALPQSSSSQKITYGQMNALAITKVSKNIAGAFRVIGLLTNAASMTTLDTALGLPPVRRDLLSVVPSDATSAIFYDGAIRAKGWLNPNREGTDQVFQNMIESVTSGRLEVSDAVGKANAELKLLFKNIMPDQNTNAL